MMEGEGGGMMEGEGGGMMEGEGGGMMEGEGGGMMEGKGGRGMVWCREGGGALELTHLGSSSHSSVVVRGGSLCPREPVVHVRSCHPGVGHHPRALEGCAGGGALTRRGFTVMVWAWWWAFTWVGGRHCPWAIVVHGSVVGASLWWAGGRCPFALVGGVGGGARRPWWLSVGLQRGGGRHSLA